MIRSATNLQILSPPKDDAVEVEGVLDDAGGGHPGAEDVLLRGQVVLLRGPLYLLHETAQEEGVELGLDVSSTFMKMCSKA